MLVSIPRGQTDTLSPHRHVTWSGMLDWLQLQPPPCTYPLGDRPVPGRARGQQCLAGCLHQPRGQGRARVVSDCPLCWLPGE